MSRHLLEYSNNRRLKTTDGTEWQQASAEEWVVSTYLTGVILIRPLAKQRTTIYLNRSRSAKRLQVERRDVTLPTEVIKKRGKRRDRTLDSTAHQDLRIVSISESHYVWDSVALNKHHRRCPPWRGCMEQNITLCRRHERSKKTDIWTAYKVDPYRCDPIGVQGSGLVQSIVINISRLVLSFMKCSLAACWEWDVFVGTAEFGFRH